MELGRRTCSRLAVVLSCCSVAGCSENEPEQAPAPRSPAPAPAASSSAKLPKLLYLPDGGTAPPAAPDGVRGPTAPRVHSERCPPEMVDVAGRFCIDRWEVSLVDLDEGRTLSPHYHPTRGQTTSSWQHWSKHRLSSQGGLARSMVVPAPPSFQLSESFEPSAVARVGVLPNGYLSRKLAETVCSNAGKRLCSEAEWVTACRGEADTDYPYGAEYRADACNVFRAAHPAHLLHGNPSINHLDPRLNLVKHRGRPLLERTGQRSECVSKWGGDGVHDMVGNLAEWVADESGVFLGGFYSRNAKNGCARKVSSHGPTYFDYSLGTRCCK